MIGQLANSTCKLHQQLIWATRCFASNTDPVRLSADVYGANNDISTNTPLIILHGIFGSKHNWRKAARVLERKLKKRVYALDARNHGDSETSPHHSSPAMAADVEHFMKINKLPKACIMGHSMGGQAMMYFALKYPQLVDRCIIIDISPLSFPVNMQKVHGIFNIMRTVTIPPETRLRDARKKMKVLMKENVKSKTFKHFVSMNLRKDETGKFYWTLNIDALEKNIDLFKQFPQQIANLPPFTGPILFCCGKKSKFFKQSDLPAVQKIFPKAELYWVNSEHLVHFQKHIDFMDAVVKFLRK